MLKKTSGYFRRGSSRRNRKLGGKEIPEEIIFALKIKYRIRLLALSLPDLEAGWPVGEKTYEKMYD